MNERSRYPVGWNRERVDDVLAHYESQTENEALAEVEAAYEDVTHTLVDVPNEVLPAVREILARKGV